MQPIKKHIEWVVFAGGLLLLAFMDPQTSGTSFCLFEWAGISFCPGEGLGHSIAYTFRGQFTEALNAHILGPLTILVLTGRIIVIWQNRIFNERTNYKKETHNG